MKQRCHSYYWFRLSDVRTKRHEWIVVILVLSSLQPILTTDIIKMMSGERAKSIDWVQ